MTGTATGGRSLPQFQRALSISEKANGPEHWHTAGNLVSLASNYQDMGKFSDALPLLQRALAITERVHGSDHPYTSQTLNNLGLLHQEMGNHVNRPGF